MGLLGVKRIDCPQNQWTTIISNFGTGMPANWDITFKAKDGGKVDGTYIEKRYLWIFPQQPVTGKIVAQMKFERYWINAIYSLKVCPTTDLIAEID
jgi:hypothetical protein